MKYNNKALILHSKDAKVIHFKMNISTHTQSSSILLGLFTALKVPVSDTCVRHLCPTHEYEDMTWESPTT